MSLQKKIYLTPSEVRLIRLTLVLAKTGLSKTTTYRLIDKGEFPRPVSIGARAIAFVESEVDQWIESKISQRNGVAA